VQFGVDALGKVTVLCNPDHLKQRIASAEDDRSQLLEFLLVKNVPFQDVVKPVHQKSKSI
jgi:hypothetical protein